MGLIQANGIKRKISLVVFDKDGLMFQSQPFWAGIGNERIARLKEYLNEEQIAEWARVLNLSSKRIYDRLSRGWSIENALSPKKYQGKRRNNFG